MSIAIDVTEQTFQRDVLDRSHEMPVVVDFWAAWCGPCRSLGPVLEKLADEAQGSWVLAKVDVDSNPNLAAAAGVQGIPAVRAFRDGKQVAEFVGALPEPQVRQWLEQLGPSPADLVLRDGFEAEQRGELQASADSYRAALNLDPGHSEARSALARVELQMRAADIDIDELQSRAEADPGDVEAVLALADAHAARGDLMTAFELLLRSVAAADGDDRDRLRKHLVGLLETIPGDDPRAVEVRRALSRLLF